MIEFDKGELVRLYERYSSLLYQRCLWLLGNEADAKDALQEVFVRVMKNIHTLKDQSSPYSWICRVATNYCLTQQRNARSRRLLLQRMVQPVLEEQNHAQPVMEHPHLWEQISEEVDLLSQEIAVMAYVDGMTQKEIQEVTGLSRKAVRGRLDKFTQVARKVVEPASAKACAMRRPR